MLNKAKGKALPQQITVYVCCQCGEDAVESDKQTGKRYCDKHKPSYC